MTRDEAVDLLVMQELPFLSLAERESLLLEWWSIDEDDPEHAELSDDVKQEMARTEEPADPGSAKYDPLLRIALRHEFSDALGSWLATRLKIRGIDLMVEGSGPRRLACPCCGYETLVERGAYEICRVCFWEDTGSDDLDTFSGPNHTTLREGRESFDRIGASREADLKHVGPDARQRFARSPLAR